jgi:serine/threonine-protein kinase RsbW
MLEILRKGYEVTCAQSAAEAQYIVDRGRTEAIIVEYEACMEEHALFKLAVDREPVPIIMLASTKDCASIIKKPVPHVDQCLQKPVSASKLICALEIAIASYTRRLIHLANSFGRSAGVLLADQLPREFPGFKLEVLSGTATYGGGDFALALSGQGFMRLVLADIMGHGLPAKAAAISLSSIIRTLHCQSAMTSDNLLQSISHMVGREPSFDGIISTLIIVDAANDGRVDAACAGHPPIAIISSERSFVLPCTGPLPGLVSAPDYQLASHRLQVGDRIVIVSDGIDHQSAATANFPDRLLKKLSMKPSLPLQTLKEDMEQWLLEQLGPAPKDDWTLMIGEYCGVSDRPN